MISSVVLLAVLAIGAWAFWRRGARGIGFVIGLCAFVLAVGVLRELPWPAYVAASAVLLTAGWHRYARSAGVVTRFAARTRRRAGVASAIEIWRNASVRAMRRRTGIVRPSLANLSRWERRKVAAADVAVQLCRSGLMRVWAAIEDVVLVFGGPRSGKTGWMAGRVIDHPGAAVVTSTRTDLLKLCGPFRAKRGPVLVFNAVGLAGIASTITFDPLTGCTDPVTAMERATDMIAASSHRGGSGDREFWDGQARRILAALLHAAALDGVAVGGKRSMRDVQAWLSDPGRAAREVPALLRRSQVAAFEMDVTQFLDTNPNTRTSITSSVMPALTWLNHPAATAAAVPGTGFDVAALLDAKATVFLLGAQEAHGAPLVTALTGHIAREARRLAAAAPEGRLDPPLGLFLDEAFLICPVPLENWTADMGGRGVTICAAFQGRAQVLSRWGERDGATILNNAASVMVFGGTKDRDDLIFWSTLAGDRDERVTTTDLHGRVASKTLRRVPVVPPAQIANLPEGRVLVIRRGIAPVLGKATMAWRRPDVRWAAYTTTHPVAAARLRTLGRLGVVAGDRLVAGSGTLATVVICGFLFAGLAVQLAAAAGIEHRWAWLASLTGCLLGLMGGAGLAAAVRRWRRPVLAFLRARVYKSSERRWLGRRVFSQVVDPDPADPPTIPLPIVPPDPDGGAR